MKTMHLFAGIGGGLLADVILGHTPVVAVEINPYCCQVLRERCDDGWFPGMHIHEGDVRSCDFSSWKGRVDQISAGFPCQDISAAGRGTGITGERSGLVSEVWRAIDSIHPRFVFLENSPRINTRGRDVVWKELESRGYSVTDGTLAASDVGALHIRNRWWLLATDTDGNGNERGSVCSGRNDPARESSEREKGSSRDQDRSKNATSSDGLQLREQSRRGSRTEWGSEAKYSETSSHLDGPRQLQCQRIISEKWGRISDETQDTPYPDGLGRNGWTGNESETNRRAKLEDGSPNASCHGCRSWGTECAGQQGQVQPFGCAPSPSDTLRDRLQISIQQGWLSDTDGEAIQAASGYCGEFGWNQTNSDICGMVHGVSPKVESIKGLGNAQVPLQAALAWVLLYRKLMNKGDQK